ncbi:protein FAR1-RELATED SEQUENCE 5-like [Bidens hawaiensis]|uniref:protein FAR1-RELATED SEQUENCE 5-like n=1 Tax=Bidens hawaiensis TaxID=980011 RepID=UPI00404B19F6
MAGTGGNVGARDIVRAGGRTGRRGRPRRVQRPSVETASNTEDEGSATGGNQNNNEGVFGSHEELMNWVQNLARSLGVVAVTKRSNKYPNGFVYKVVIMCDRGGKYKVKDSSKVSGTKKTDCPFELEGKYSIEYNSWTLTMICDEHNHPPVQHMEGHPYAKRLTDDEFSLVAELTRMNVAPRDILSILKERNLSNASTISTIYNARTKIRMSEQAGNSPMQVLMSILHSNGYVYEFTTTGSNELENLFFVHPISFDIWRAFPHVLIIDATYKTNSYNMPFVQIVGVTSTNKTFSIAFAFMQNEKIESYTWVLNCLKLTLDKCMHPRVILTDRELALVNACKEVFPNATQLLCRWHISRNIFKNCRQSIRSKFSSHLQHFEGDMDYSMMKNWDLCDLQFDSKGVRVLPPVGLRAGGFFPIPGDNLKTLEGSVRLD